jgi:CheY-like chemotaxis protein
MIKAFQNFCEKFTDDNKVAFSIFQQNLSSLGWIAVLGHPLYWYIWTYIFPQPYESIVFRSVSALVCVPFIFHERVPPSLSKWKPVYWYFAVTLTLPSIFAFLLLMNDFSRVYVTCEIMLIFLLVTFLPGIVSVMISLLAGTLIGYIAYLCATPPEHALKNIGTLIEFSPLLIFALFAGSIFSGSFKENLQIRQMRMAAQEREKCLTALAGSIAHEMRNPLGQIRFSLHGVRNLLPRPIAQEEPGTPHPTLSPADLNKIYGHLAQGEIAMDRGLQIVAMTLDEVSGRPINPTSFEYLPASATIQKAVEEYSFDSPGERNKVKVHIRQDFTLKANETACIFILFNLIKNALFYFKQLPQATLTITVDAPHIRVHDTGPGMTPEVLGTLFGCFATSGKEGGTGLGLAYCQRTMRAFGGEIACDSVHGEYTEFTLRFPIITRAEIDQHEREVLGLAAPFFEGKRILVVDDQWGLRKATRAMLDGLGCRQDEAEDGAQAIAKLREHPYDLIVMDLNMPGLDGYATAEQIRQGVVPEQRNVAIVAYTSESAYMAHVKTEKVGMNGFVSKPCTRLELIKALHAGMQAATYQALQDETAASVLVGKTVLVVDDGTFNRQIAKASLRSMGIEALEADSGHAALELLRRHDAIDAILLDMEMPVMDGLQAAREIRKGQAALARRLPIIALTANSSEQHVAQAMAAGMDDFISKPFLPDELRAILIKALTPGESGGHFSAAAVAADANGVPLIHTERLDQMRMLDRTLLTECLTAHIEQMKEHFVQLEAQMANGNFLAFRSQLHMLLGDAGAAGFHALHQFLKTEVYPAVVETQAWPEPDTWLATARALYTQTERVVRRTYLTEA